MSNDNKVAQDEVMAWHQASNKSLYKAVTSSSHNVSLLLKLNRENMTKLDMSTARRRLKSPCSLSGTSTHPTMVTLVNIMVMNRWLTSFSFHVNRPPHSWDTAISDSELQNPRSRSWVWARGNVIQSAQNHINPLPFHFTSIRPTIP